MSVKNSNWSQQKQGFGKKKRKLLWVKCFFQSFTQIRLNFKKPFKFTLFKMYKVKFTWLWKSTWNFTNKYFTWKKRLWLFKESWAKHSVELQNIYWDFKIFAKPSKLKVNVCSFTWKISPVIGKHYCCWTVLHCSLKLKFVVESQGFPLI